jgi:MerR family transcriptional regulator/heat shock protein HspR
VILNLTRELGVNLAGVEIILNMRRRMEQVQQEVNEFVAWVGQELGRAAKEGWQERLQQALVRLPPTPLVRAATSAPLVAERPDAPDAAVASSAPGGSER